MGVPGFFAWLVRKYKTRKIIIYEVDNDIDILYIDANCLFHPQCFKVLDMNPDWEDSEKLQKKMMKRIIEYIKFLIEYVNPTKKVYIAVDGVAPIAKINQQRQRRFRSKLDNDVQRSIKEEFGQKLPNFWSNSAITPGTEFMEKLHMELIKFGKTYKDIEIIISSYHTPGEGEHKLFDDIRTRSTSHKDENYAVYGLDADLIFLSLASAKKNIYLLREVVKLGKLGKERSDFLADKSDVVEEMNYVDIDVLHNVLKEELCTQLEEKMRFYPKSLNELNIVNDFIFVCYFLGNDFLPHLPSVNIKHNGLDVILDCYISTLIFFRTPLLQNKEGHISINEIFLGMFIETLAENEDEYFKYGLPKAKNRSKKFRCPSSDPCDRKLWDLEHLKFDIDDQVKLGIGTSDLWKSRYYEHYFHIKHETSGIIDSACEKYFEGLLWVTKYYFEGCSSWSWFYPFNHAPFLSDLSNYIKNKKMRMSEITFELGKPLDPCTQLLVVLPSFSSYLLPDKYKQLVTSSVSPIIDLYPIDFRVDLINKDMHWEGIAELPYLDIDRIVDATNGIKLTVKENIRNTVEKYWTNKKFSKKKVTNKRIKNKK
jgi:5'-3' exonuclease